MINFIKKQWSRKLLIGMSIWAVFMVYFHFGKIDQSGIIDITKWLVGLMFLGNVGEKAVGCLNKTPGSLFSPENDQSGTKT